MASGRAAFSDIESENIRADVHKGSCMKPKTNGPVFSHFVASIKYIYISNVRLKQPLQFSSLSLSDAIISLVFSVVKSLITVSSSFEAFLKILTAEIRKIIIL